MGRLGECILSYMLFNIYIEHYYSQKESLPYASRIGNLRDELKEWKGSRLRCDRIPEKETIVFRCSKTKDAKG